MQNLAIPQPAQQLRRLQSGDLLKPFHQVPRGPSPRFDAGLFQDGEGQLRQQESGADGFRRKLPGLFPAFLQGCKQLLVVRENPFDKIQFRRVDAGVDGLTDDVKADEEQEKKLKEIFQTALDDKDLDVKLVSLKSDELPAMITVEEQSRRFTEMSRQWGGGMTLPEKRTLTLNLKHPLVAYLNGDSADEETRKLVCEQIVDLAEMARQPLVAERMVAFLRRSNQILCKAVENK